MPLLEDGGLNPSLDPQSVLRIFGHSYRCRVLSHCFGVGLNPTPMDVGLSPMLFFPTVLGVGLNPTPAYGRWVKSHVVLSHCFRCATIEFKGRHIEFPNGISTLDSDKER